MPEIRPIKDLRDTTKISEFCYKNQGANFYHKNGYGDLVIRA